MSIASASLLPLITEEIYLGLTRSAEEAGSVHLADFPKLDPIIINDDLVISMDQVLDICSNALFIRNAQNIRVRQPLASLTIISRDIESLRDFEELIKEEINVKEIIYKNDLENYGDYKLSINFPVLGKRLPNKVKEIIIASKKHQWQVIGENVLIAEEKLDKDEFALILEPKNTIGTKSLTNNQGLILLDLNITDALHDEAIARDLVRFIQQSRKEADFAINDRIILEITGTTDKLMAIIDQYKNFISEQTLSEINNSNDLINPDYQANIELNSHNIMIKLKNLNLT
jgi:isoleucyl-tRNA synthetase